jgi:hypothetical protein
VAGGPPANARYEGRRKHIPSRRPSFTNACARERQLPHRTFLRHSERRVDGAVLNDRCSRNSAGARNRNLTARETQLPSWKGSLGQSLNGPPQW